MHHVIEDLQKCLHKHCTGADWARKDKKRKISQGKKRKEKKRKISQGKKRKEKKRKEKKRKEKKRRKRKEAKNYTELPR